MDRRIRLEYQADQIEATLASHRIRTRVEGGTVTPRFVRFDLRPAPGTRINGIRNLAEELALSLDAPSCRISRRGGRVLVEVPRSEPGCVDFLAVCSRLRNVPAVTALLGLDEDGVPVLLRLPSPDVAHALIAGNTGSGKTALARTMALSLALFNPLRQVQLVLIDAKRRGLDPLAGLPHLLTPLISDPGLAADTLGRLAREMERRDLDDRSAPAIVVFIDELADLLMSGGDDIADPLTRLAHRGREAGIHLVACTQRPTASVIGGLVKSNFPVRLVGSVASAEDAKVAAGLPKTGAERLLGRGDFVVIARGQQMRVQAAFASPAEIRRVAASLNGPFRDGSSGIGSRVKNAGQRLANALPALVGMVR